MKILTACSQGITVCEGVVVPFNHDLFCPTIARRTRILSSISELPKTSFCNREWFLSVTFDSYATSPRIDKSALAESGRTALQIRASVDVFCTVCFRDRHSLTLVPFESVYLPAIPSSRFRSVGVRLVCGLVPESVVCSALRISSISVLKTKKWRKQTFPLLTSAKTTSFAGSDSSTCLFEWRPPCYSVVSQRRRSTAWPGGSSTPIDCPIHLIDQIRKGVSLCAVWPCSSGPWERLCARKNPYPIGISF
jgi:hypothetical protein